jgi:hypothetical protein
MIDFLQDLAARQESTQAAQQVDYAARAVDAHLHEDVVFRAISSKALLTCIFMQANWLAIGRNGWLRKPSTTVSARGVSSSGLTKFLANSFPRPECHVGIEFHSKGACPSGIPARRCSFDREFPQKPPRLHFMRVTWWRAYNPMSYGKVNEHNG